MPENHIPLERWGKDHWSTFAFVAHWCCQFGAKGFQIAGKKRQMRCDPARHPAQAHIEWEEDNPTLLANGEQCSPHDDWDCLYDAETAGLVRLEGSGVFPLVFMTDAGLRVSNALSDHRTCGGRFGDFERRIRAEEIAVGPEPEDFRDWLLVHPEFISARVADGGASVILATLNPDPQQTNQTENKK